MKNAFRMLIALCLLIVPVGNTFSADGEGNKTGEIKQTTGPVKEEKTPAGSSAFDETTTQYLKKFRSLNSELVAAHRDLQKYSTPERDQKSISMADLLDQQSAANEARQQKQTKMTKKAGAEEKIGKLQKEIENLKLDLIKYYNGKLPKHVSDAWRTEEGYTAYLISRIK